MEMNVVKTKVMRILREAFPVQNVADQKDLDNVGYFNYLGCMITNDARCIRKIRPKIVTGKAAFNNKKTFHQQTELKFKQETSEVLHLEHRTVWC